MSAGTSTTPGDGYNNDYIDSLVWGCQWFEGSSAMQGTTADPIDITYSFGSGVIPGYSVVYENWGYDFYATEIIAFETAMSLLESVCNINFVSQAYSSSYDSQSNVVFYSVDSEFFGYFYESEYILGMFEVPDGSYTSNYGYFNWEGASWTVNGGFNLLPGSDGFNTIIHELGHGLGLAHPHDGGSEVDGEIFPGVNNSGATGTDGLNQGIWTVMSYNSDWDTEPGSSDYLYGYGILGAFDIAALQVIYGVNTAYNSGSNTYYLPSVNEAGTGWLCLWDGGGDEDTISNSGSSLSCEINLNPAPLVGQNAGGYVSWNSGISGGFTIANGAIIENAIGGLGDDTLTGNAQSNTISGDAGDDILDGGAGDDILDGGAGDDTYVVDSASDEVIEGTSTGKDLVKVAIAAVGGRYDLVSNIENATLTNTVSFKLYGNSLDNKLVGNAKDNTLNGGAGKDILAGGAGNDTYVVDSVSDVVTELASSGIDMVEVAIAADGGSYNLGSNIENATLKNTVAYKLYGNLLDNKLVGNAKDNTLNGGTGKDTLTGGSGKDKFVFDTALSSSNIDTIKDFTTTKGTDKIVLDDDIFTKLSGTNAGVSLDAKYFGSSGKQATGKAGADDYFYFKSSTLYYDADGNGSGTAKAVVELVGITCSSSDLI